jgi:hypothetical protein
MVEMIMVINLPISPKSKKYTMLVYQKSVEVIIERILNRVTTDSTRTTAGTEVSGKKRTKRVDSVKRAELEDSDKGFYHEMRVKSERGFRS